MLFAIGAAILVVGLLVLRRIFSNIREIYKGTPKSEWSWPLAIVVLAMALLGVVAGVGPGHSQLPWKAALHDLVRMLGNK